MENKVLKVNGMSCSHCENAVNNAVSALEGVQSVNVSLEDGIVTVVFDSEKVSLANIVTEIEEQGYDVES